MKEDPFKVLGVSSQARPAEIRAAYKQRVRQCHPDASKSPDTAAEFRRVTEAYQDLQDPKKREQAKRNSEMNQARATPWSTHATQASTFHPTQGPSRASSARHSRPEPIMSPRGAEPLISPKSPAASFAEHQQNAREFQESQDPFAEEIEFLLAFLRKGPFSW